MKFKHSFQISKFKFQILGALLALGTFVAIFYSLTRPASAAWFDELWAYRNAIPITSHTAAENNVYVSTTLDTNGGWVQAAMCMGSRPARRVTTSSCGTTRGFSPASAFSRSYSIWA